MFKLLAYMLYIPCCSPLVLHLLTSWPTVNNTVLYFRAEEKVEPKKEAEAPAKEGEKAAADSKEAPKEEKPSTEEKMEHWGSDGYF